MLTCSLRSCFASGSRHSWSCPLAEAPLRPSYTPDANNTPVYPAACSWLPRRSTVATSEQRKNKTRPSVAVVHARNHMIVWAPAPLAFAGPVRGQQAERFLHRTNQPRRQVTAASASFFTRSNHEMWADAKSGLLMARQLHARSIPAPAPTSALRAESDRRQRNTGQSREKRRVWRCVPASWPRDPPEM
ncbi:uncharacterized protein PV09_03554 [Verruconis gallopava]|uniref:Uncharacterized protein n=1 Tax=Verruconis gallopava TaxID=253628 RepID=A0A0D1YYB1_9PEZI|nr:uncharacterized protein PV09_03554 [Verruconis gallopava]KIW05692.1 hypothetical protein PV09_03554 [Verruconis gallopava]